MLLTDKNCGPVYHYKWETKYFSIWGHQPLPWAWPFILVALEIFDLQFEETVTGEWRGLGREWQSLNLPMCPDLVKSLFEGT